MITQSVSILGLLKQPHFTFYKVYVQREFSQVVFLNPKVGSTAFREIVVAAMQQQNRPPPRGRMWPMNLTRRYTTAPLRDYLHAFAHVDQYQWHCFVRNPYARVISAWNDKLVKGFHAPQYPRSMRSLVPKLRRFAGNNDLLGSDDNSPLPFSTFLHFIESQKEGQRNQHWDTQVSVLCADQIPFTHIHHIETNFVNGMEQILTPLGVERSWIEDQLARPINASGRPSESVLNQDIADRIYAVYKADFEHFGYARESWRAI
jgi:Sulfotransferase family